MREVEVGLVALVGVAVFAASALAAVTLRTGERSAVYRLGRCDI